MSHARTDLPVAHLVAWAYATPNMISLLGKEARTSLITSPFQLTSPSVIEVRWELEDAADKRTC
eukprot:37670-Eustigmatos_ZCMA.PRE.1